MITPAPNRCALCASPLRLWFERAGRHQCVCAACGHLQVLEGLARTADGGSIYEAGSDLFDGDDNRQYYLDDENHTVAREKVAFVRRFCAGGTLLDVGANYGYFLAAAVASFDAWGLEPNAEAVVASRQRFGVRNYVGVIEEPAPVLPATVDVVTCWDVIEHLEDPAAALTAIRGRLRPGGWLFLSTPDAGSLVARLMGRRWHFLDPVQHLHLFSRERLATVLGRAGFEMIDVRSFGRSYRIDYILKRLGYLGLLPFGRRLSALLPANLTARRVRIGLGDVSTVAARLR